MPSDALFGPTTSTDRMLAATSETAWVEAMLQVEAALARVESRLGLIPEPAAARIVARCRAGGFDVVRLGRDAVHSTNPVMPLVDALRAALPKDTAPYVHMGATSQDVLDTAMMLIARRGLDLILEDLERAAAAVAALADHHRATVMAARTLLQQALVTTFGLKAAGWLAAMVDARSELIRVRRTRLALQFGGAAGTLAALSDRGLEVGSALAAELDLPEPVLPWHTARNRIVELGSALGITAGVAGKVALDVVLMGQTEVAEVWERPGRGHGESSALPQKRNPVTAVEILAGVRGVTAEVGVLQGAMLQEHERAAGAWQAEWPALAEALRLTGGAVFRLAGLLSALQVDPDRMRRNLELSKGLIMAERVVVMLGERVDRLKARALVDAAVAKASTTGRPFLDVLRQDPAITAHIGPGQLSAALDPQGYLGTSNTMIDRALAAYREATKERT